MFQKTFVAASAILLAGTCAQAQYTNVFPGSTVEGDYLRGVGIAAMGLGVYNVDTAIANSINTDTAIRWNEYVSAMVEYQARKYHARREQFRSRRLEDYNLILKRILETPEERDVRSGDSLNAMMMQLLDPTIPESAFRFEPVPLSTDNVRKIAFKLDKKNLVFSMHRLTATGKDKWPPALQDPRFASERRAYDRALDSVLEQEIEGKMTIDAGIRVEQAVDDLYRRLDQVLTPSREVRYLEAKNRLNDLKKIAHQLLQSHDMELIFGELDQYSGVTVRDLLVFMQRHKIGFAAAETPEEHELYPKLYTALKLQYERVSGAAKQPVK